MFHCILIVCHRWVSLPLALTSLVKAIWAAGSIFGASKEDGSPILATSVTMPCFLRSTTHCVLYRLVWVLFTPLCCHAMIIDSKAVVGADSPSSTEGAAAAVQNSDTMRSVVDACQLCG